MNWDRRIRTIFLSSLTVSYIRSIMLDIIRYCIDRGGVPEANCLQMGYVPFAIQYNDQEGFYGISKAVALEAQIRGELFR